MACRMLVPQRTSHERSKSQIETKRTCSSGATNEETHLQRPHGLCDPGQERIRRSGRPSGSTESRDHCQRCRIRVAQETGSCGKRQARRGTRVASVHLGRATTQQSLIFSESTVWVGGPHIPVAIELPEPERVFYGSKTLLTSLPLSSLV